MLRPTAVAVLGMVSLILLHSGCSSQPSQAASESSAAGAPRAALIRVEQAVREPVRARSVVMGNIVARRTSIVASGAEGKVDEYRVRVGQPVDESDVLSVLNMVTTDLGIAEARQVLAGCEQEYLELAHGSRAEEIAETRARMDAAEVTMRVMADKLDRVERLVRANAANQDDLDDARERSQAAAKMYLAAKANWELMAAGPRAEKIAQAQARRDAQQVQVDYLLAEREKRFTRAPFRGIVVAEHSERGQWLSKGDPVATIADIVEEVHVIANVDQRELPNVIVGSTVDVEIAATSQRMWQGTVMAVVPRSDWQAGARAFPVKVAVKNMLIQAGGQQIPVLSEGMLARVTFLGPPHDAVLVPKDAVIRSEAGARLYIVLPGADPAHGKAQPVVIQQGLSEGHRIEVLNSDVQPGMQVVTEGAERLQPFADVEILPAVASPVSAP